MAANYPVEIIDDEDEFDWEAAVKEIDVACQNNPKPSTSLCEISPSLYTTPVNTSVVDEKSYGNCLFVNKNKRPAASKQSTLDKFIAKPGPRAQPENRTVDDRYEGCVEGNEKPPSVEIDAEAAKTWIYPVNVPLRDYQLAMTKTALFSNTLVALPTGLGKTLIAAVVMYNYFRWFPEGKIVFAAPSRPLVMQQIEACHNIVGIPQEWTTDLTGQISPIKRTLLWKSKRIFFVTPQVLEKDIQAGTCPVQYLVCLVIDEAHRASGNYSFCVAVRELMAVPVQLRILALSATPGSKQQAIQNIIDNLQIATLEYRNENDPDVSPYVHNRKVEMIEVPLGKDAHEINTQLSEVIRPYYVRLSSMGLIQSRDYQTLSPCDLLLSRDRFRQAPPLDLPNAKHGDVESCFAALITLYHIRKLLSSHGIRPAYEMLDEKLRQGSFARLMSKNEDIRKAKLLMERSLSHGAPSPKLSKMLEVLVDHYKTKDPKTSRVIIFSNFRGSVRDIMNALTTIDGLVKATEFIGQSSGKTLKGQSQKVQQAVLEKFRAGGYNVIVATSIGEEGLDIMEVDLVICFDANVSPLRMIQRMGRTGRKHDGRVVVLACEGSELKGYMRKQANSRAINKHMGNGGKNSFNFHSSPRMIPHTCKPEVQFIELSIEQYISRGKKPKDDNAVQTPLLLEDKLTESEADLIGKYFNPGGEKNWRPSLIAFPHFQAFPSKIHKVMHSFRTGMLIDSMQCLQGFNYSGESKTFNDEDSSVFLGVNNVEQLGNGRKDSDSDSHTSYDVPSHKSQREVTDSDSHTSYDVPSHKSQREVTDSEVSSIGPSNAKGTHNVPEFNVQSSAAHSNLFNSGFVSVDALGNVTIISVPSLPIEVEHQKDASDAQPLSIKILKPDSCHFKTSAENQDNLILPDKAVENLIGSQANSLKGNSQNVSSLRHSCTQERKIPKEIEKFADAPILERDILIDVDGIAETAGAPEIKAISGVIESTDAELSPRLTNLIKCGVVPESPIAQSGKLRNEERGEYPALDLASPAKDESGLLSNSLKSDKDSIDGILCVRNVIVSQTPLHQINHCASIRGWTSISPAAGEIQTPVRTSTGCSKDWHLSSGEGSRNAGSKCMFKRLRKVGDWKNDNQENMNERSMIPIANLARSFSPTGLIKRSRRRKGQMDGVKAFIDEEADVSSEAEQSVDEEDDQRNDSYDDSFIDDRVNPTAGTQADSSGVDMMAIYRRSLLSQSPSQRHLNCSATSSPDCHVAPISRINESGSSSGKSSLRSLNITPENKFNNQYARMNSELSNANQERISPDIRPYMAERSAENEMEIESRKRKLSFCQSDAMAATNNERESFPQVEVCENGDEFDDDQFYEGLDLDAVEAQATIFLEQRSNLSAKKQDILNHKPFDFVCSPSFDLGI